MSCLIKPTLGWIIIVQKKISYSCNIFKQNHIESEWIVRGKKKKQKNLTKPRAISQIPNARYKIEFPTHYNDKIWFENTYATGLISQKSY